MHPETDDLPAPRRRAAQPTQPASLLALALQADEAEIARAKDEPPTGRYSLFPEASERTSR